jgi:hypothetical protein
MGDDTSLEDCSSSTSEKSYNFSTMAQPESTARWDRKIVGTLIAVLISNISYIVIAPFLPPEF